MSVVDKIASVKIAPEQQEFYDQIAEADAVLKSSSDEKKLGRALLLKARALLELDLPQRVIPLFGKQAPRSEAETVVLAYSLYRLGRLNDLRSSVSAESPLGARLALAQAEYRFGSLEQAKTLLDELIPLLDEENAEDASVNINAIGSLQGILPSSALTSFDDYFNAACACLARGDTTKADEMLEQCLNLSDEPEDVVSVNTQKRISALLKDKNDAEAAQYLSKMQSNSELSASEQLVVRNNVLVAHYTSNTAEAVHTALKTYDEVHNCALELNSVQKKVLERNMLKLLSRVGVKTLKRAKKHADQFPTDLEPLVLAYHYTQRKSEIRKLSEKGDLAAKLWLDAVNNVKRSSLTSKLEAGSLNSVFQAAKAAYSSAEPKVGPKADELRSYFESLPDPELKTAGLSILATPASISSETAVSKPILDSINRITSGIDVDSALEQALDAKSSLTSSVKAKKNRNKRARPASFDEAKQPDPERWIAKQDRSSNKKKKTGMTQGSGAVDLVMESNIPAKQSSGQVVTSKPRKNVKRKGRK